MTAKRHGLGFDLDGQPLAYSSDEVNTMLDRAYDDPHTKVVLVILKKGGDLMVQIMGEPTRAILQQLEQATAAYRRILRGQ
jgi:hypothetical protein